MAWWIPAIMAAAQANTAARKQAKQEKFNQGQAEANKYSPWTGMTNQLDQSYVADPLSAGAAGFVQGMSIQQGIGEGGSNPAPSDTDLSANMFAQQAAQAKPMQQPSIYNNNMYNNPWNIPT